MDLATRTVAAFPDESNTLIEPTTTDSRPLFRGRQFTRILDTLQQALIERRHLCCLLGAPGSGVTRLLDTLQRCNTRDLICRLEVTGPGQLLFDLLAALKICIPGESEAAARRRLCFALSSGYNKDMPVLVLVDAAERLTPADLNLLLHLFSGSFAQIVLAGRPALLDRLQDAAVERQPDCVYHLTPYDFDDTQAYIQYYLRAARLPVDLFDADAIDALFIYSGGVLRTLNRLLGKVLAQAECGKGETLDAVWIQQSVFGEVAGEHCPLADAPNAEAAAERAVDRPMPSVPELQIEEVAVASGHDATGIPVLTDIVLVTVCPKTARYSQAAAAQSAAPEVTRHAAMPSASVRDAEIDADDYLIKPVWRDAALIAGVAILALLAQSGLTALSQQHRLFASMLDRVVLAWSTPAPMPITAPVTAHSNTISTPSNEPVQQPAARFAPSVDFAALHALSPPLMPPSVDHQTRVPDEAIANAAPSASTVVDDERPAPKQEAELSPEQLIEVANLYAGRAEYEIEQGEWKAARQSVELGLKADPANLRLQQLQSHLRLMFGETAGQSTESQALPRIESRVESGIEPSSAVPDHSLTQPTGPVQQLF